MAIFLLIVLYIIISIASTGGDFFAWYMLTAFIVVAIVMRWAMHDDLKKRDKEFDRKLEEYKKSQGWDK